MILKFVHGPTAVVAALMLLGACDQGGAASAPTGTSSTAPPAPAAAPPPPLMPYSREVMKSVTFAGDPVLAGYFCKAATGAACDAPLQAKFAGEGFADGGTVVDMAYAAVMVKAKSAPEAAAKVSDEQFVAAAYEVVLGRTADPQGLAGNLQFLVTSKDRKGVVTSLLSSAEFQQRPV